MCGCWSAVPPNGTLCRLHRGGSIVGPLNTNWVVVISIGNRRPRLQNWNLQPCRPRPRRQRESPPLRNQAQRCGDGNPHSRRLRPRRSGLRGTRTLRKLGIQSSACSVPLGVARANAFGPCLSNWRFQLQAPILPMWTLIRLEILL